MNKWWVEYNYITCKYMLYLYDDRTIRETIIRKVIELTDEQAKQLGFN